MDQYLDELKTACAAIKRSDPERISAGDSTWFAGRPAPADKGFIAIAQDEDIHTVIRVEDVQEVRKEQDIYLVKVSADANVLVRYERVTKAKPEDCGCGDEDKGEAASSGAAARMFADDPFGPFGAPIGHCRLYVRCWYWRGLPICFWVIHCPGRVGRI